MEEQKQDDESIKIVNGMFKREKKENIIKEMDILRDKIIKYKENLEIYKKENPLSDFNIYEDEYNELRQNYKNLWGSLMPHLENETESINFRYINK